MKAKIIKFFFACLIAFAASGSAGAYYNPGSPAGFVNDYANILTSEQKLLLENKFVQFEKDSSNEIAIAVIKDLRGDTIENFAEKLFKDWGIGKKGADNGVLILVAIDNREMRIEVGYGLEGALTDAQANRIVNETMKPAFQKSDFFKGLNGATDQIIAAVKGENVFGSKDNAQNQRDTNILFAFAIGMQVFMFAWAILGSSKSWWLGGVLGVILGIAIGVIKNSFHFGLISAGILLPIGLLLDFAASKLSRYRIGKSHGSYGRWGGGGGGGGFGGFGGGGSGGGGSSGRW